MMGTSAEAFGTGFSPIYCPHSSSSTTPTHDYIVRAKDGHHVGDHIALRHVVECAHMNEGGRADFEPIGFAFAVAHDVKAQLAFRGLRPAIDLALRRLESFREQFE